MAEYIEREQALKGVCDACDVIPEHERELCQYKFTGCKEYCNVFTIPAADVVPVVRGTWIGIDDFPYEDWECSVCGEQVFGNYSIPRDMHYCPNCGADMREVENDG